LAEKIYKIQKELEEKRAIKKQKAAEAGQPPQPNMPGQMQGQFMWPGEQSKLAKLQTLLFDRHVYSLTQFNLPYLLFPYLRLNASFLTF
jgi:hypothetical protein